MAELSLKIKEEFKSTIVGFNGCGLPLGERNDLHILARMAQYDKHIANYFEELPSGADLLTAQENSFLESHPAPAVKNATQTSDENEEVK